NFYSGVNNSPIYVMYRKTQNSYEVLYYLRNLRNTTNLKLLIPKAASSSMNGYE
ncbi:hypothetical protein L9F63_019678, partial [Diploptera punctata]